MARPAPWAPAPAAPPCGGEAAAAAERWCLALRGDGGGVLLTGQGGEAARLRGVVVWCGCCR